MSGVPFDQIEAQKGVVRVLTEMVGSKMGKLVAPDGTVTEYPAIYLSDQNIPEATLPLLEVSFISDNDGDGFLLDSGVVEVENPNDPLEPFFYPYYDNYLNYTLMLTCAGDDSGSIIRDVRKKFLNQYFRDKLKVESNSGITLVTPISRNPELLSTEYREQHTMLLNLVTVDRYIDDSDNTGVFDTIIYEGELYKDRNETDTPIPVNGTVGPVTP